LSNYEGPGEIIIGGTNWSHKEGGGDWLEVFLNALIGGPARECGPQAGRERNLFSRAVKKGERAVHRKNIKKRGRH